MKQHEIPEIYTTNAYLKTTFQTGISIVSNTYFYIQVYLSVLKFRQPQIIFESSPNMIALMTK